MARTLDITSYTLEDRDTLSDKEHAGDCLLPVYRMPVRPGSESRRFSR